MSYLLDNQDGIKKNLIEVISDKETIITGFNFSPFGTKEMEVDMRHNKATYHIHITGKDANLRADRKLLAELGAYILTGIDVDLIYSPNLQPNSYILTAETGVFSLTINPAILKYFIPPPNHDEDSYLTTELEASSPINATPMVEELKSPIVFVLNLSSRIK